MSAKSERYALITGGAVRLGRELALHLARRGFNVAIHYNRSTGPAESAAAEIRAMGQRAVLICADFRSPDATEVVGAAVRLEFGHLDLLINSAGIWPEPAKASADRSIEKETVAGWDAAVAVGARAPFFLIQDLAPLLSEGSSRTGMAGQVINILDRSISAPFVDRAAHTVAKDALLAVTHLAAKTYSGRFRVNALELGSVLPQESMSEDERRRKRWLGIEPVIRAVDWLIDDPALDGEIIPVV